MQCLEKMENWKPIDGYEGKYEVSDLGRIRSLSDKNGNRREHILVQRAGHNGYLYVNLWKRSRSRSMKIHRMVAEAFLEKNENPQCVNHKNGVKEDNRAENLEWCTYSDNTRHAVRMGLARATKGELNGMYGVHGAEHPSSKPVIKMSMDGKVLGRWDNCVIAAEENGVNRHNIARCARGDRKSAYGYRWAYEL